LAGPKGSKTIAVTGEQGLLRAFIAWMQPSILANLRL
jgi:hypothetical protein